MGIISGPEGIDFFVNSGNLSSEDERMISDYKAEQKKEEAS